LDKVHSLGKDKIHGWKIKVRKEFSDVVPRIAYAIFRAVDELEMMPDGQYRAGVLHVLPIRSASNEGEDAGARPTIFDGAVERLCFKLPAADPVNLVTKQVDFLKQMVSTHQPLQLLCSDALHLEFEEVGKQAGLLLNASRLDSSGGSDICGCWDRMARLLGVSGYGGISNQARLDGTTSFEIFLEAVVGSQSDALLRLQPWMRCLDSMCTDVQMPVVLNVLRMLQQTAGPEAGENDSDSIKPPVASPKAEDPVASAVFHLALRKGDRQSRLQHIFGLVTSTVALPMPILNALSGFVQLDDPGADNVFEVVDAVLQEEFPDDAFSRAFHALDTRRLIAERVAYQVAKSVAEAFSLNGVVEAVECACKAEKEAKMGMLMQCRKNTVIAIMGLVASFTNGVSRLKEAAEPFLEYLHDKIAKHTYLHDVAEKIQKQLIKYGKGHPIAPYDMDPDL
jgi:hypothetical protein